MVAAALLVNAAPRAAAACTTFMLERGAERVVGKSYDWYMGQGLVLVNKRGVAKRSLPVKPGDRPAQWQSRHASVTFNQYGREFPAGGMNDAGLVVEIMWLDSSTYEKADDRLRDDDGGKAAARVQRRRAHLEQPRGVDVRMIRVGEREQVAAR